MAARHFGEMLKAQWRLGKFVCVGLDSDFGKLPKHLQDSKDVVASLVSFNDGIVEATKDIALAYKPNWAFYQELGPKGLEALKLTVRLIHLTAPSVPVILDAKCADIDNTNLGYVRAAFELYDFDAVTVHPYLGSEAMAPFLERKEKGIIVLCRTSNKGAGEFQDLPVQIEGGYTSPLYQVVAATVESVWNKHNNCAVVVGATYPGELAEVRKIVGDMPILIPGVGFQQKGVPIEVQVRQVVENAVDSQGQGMIINASRSIIFASSGEDCFKAARSETQSLDAHIRYSLQLQEGR